MKPFNALINTKCRTREDVVIFSAKMLRAMITQAYNLGLDMPPRFDEIDFVVSALVNGRFSTKSSKSEFHMFVDGGENVHRISQTILIDSDNIPHYFYALLSMSLDVVLNDYFNFLDAEDGFFRYLVWAQNIISNNEILEMPFSQFQRLITEDDYKQRRERLFNKLDREEGEAFVYHLLESLVK